VDFVGSFADHPWNQRKSSSAFLLTTREANGSICQIQPGWMVPQQCSRRSSWPASLRWWIMLFHWSFRTAFIIVSWLRWIPNLVVAELMVRQRRLAPSS